MLLFELEKYLRRLGQDFRLEKCSLPGDVPLFIAENNDWHLMKIGSDEYLLAVSRIPEQDPDAVIAQWRGVVHATDRAIMVIPARDDAYCSRLDAEGVNYIMPGARLSVVGKMMLVTRHVREARAPRGRMSIHAQRILLWHLIRGTKKSELFSEILSGAMLDKSHLSRASRELERLGLVQIDSSWRAHALVFGLEKPQLWRRARDLMSSPVLRKIRLVDAPSGLPTAGIEALSERTMLAPDSMPTFAAKRGDSRVDESKDAKYSGATIEIWRYEPTLFSTSGKTVDPLSLWLSLRDEADPRVRGELDRMMEEMGW